MHKITWKDFKSIQCVFQFSHVFFFSLYVKTKEKQCFIHTVIVDRLGGRNVKVKKRVRAQTLFARVHMPLINSNDKEEGHNKLILVLIFSFCVRLSFFFSSLELFIFIDICISNPLSYSDNKNNNDKITQTVSCSFCSTSSDIFFFLWSSFFPYVPFPWQVISEFFADSPLIHPVKYNSIPLPSFY